MFILKRNRKLIVGSILKISILFQVFFIFNLLNSFYKMKKKIDTFDEKFIQLENFRNLTIFELLFYEIMFD